jgi:hypothetical protein
LSLSEPSFLHYSRPLQCKEPNAEIDAVVNERGAEIDVTAEPPAALAAVETTPDAPGVPVEQGGDDGAVRAKSPAAPGVPVEQGAGGATPDAPGVPVEQAPTASASDELFTFCGSCTMPKPSDRFYTCTKCRASVTRFEIGSCEGCQLIRQQANPGVTLCEKHYQMADRFLAIARALAVADGGSAKGSAE